MRKLKKRIILPVSILLVPLLYHIAFPKVSRCFRVQWSDAFELLQQDVYISADTPQSTRETLLEYLAEAVARNHGFWNGLEGDPKIIYAHNEEVHAQYGWPTTPATVFYTPFRAIMVVGPAGLHLDVLSHELCHTEIYGRLGWWRKMLKIPTWFDEGLAMQLDNRPEYGEAAYIQLLDTLSFFPDVKTKTSPKLFWEEGLEHSHQNYILAKHEVGQWMQVKEQLGLLNMIDEIVNEGTDFEELYKD